ncbi:Protein kinase domain-containing protein [Mycena indigotica]|uniref:Protein kinase domain-containing protein n=1 Tax=Mycena indigotica TaxID=2126181 RepID=A0A8H6SVZ6_9AGAR|nr:Protein kinase domain-containing protein [Mycena indigotica]KAF7306394.1 Protein kinase domain-containing protein [Mycena indigotica]
MDDFVRKMQALDERMKTRTPDEQFWVNHQPFLRSKGYKLRLRYQPNWTPSWTLPGSNFKYGHYYDFEDSYGMSWVCVVC